jgi:deoxycytidylate deaminase
VLEQVKLRAIELAAKSPCEKRKVGAVITDKDYNIIGEGFNRSSDCGPCEDSAGATKANVIHAEIVAIDNCNPRSEAHYLFVTQPPCNSCLVAIEHANIKEVVVIKSFMKFDGDKPRYDLIPVSWHKGDAEILTFGARKYKPNNWKSVDEIGRFVAALERHLTAFKLALETGESRYLFDADSGLHHMKHLRTNAGFLLTLTEDDLNGHQYNS